MNTLFDAFISYGRADSKTFTTNLHARLVEQGLNIWFDQKDIPLGVDFQNQIDEGIVRADNFIFKRSRKNANNLMTQVFLCYATKAKLSALQFIGGMNLGLQPMTTPCKIWDLAKLPSDLWGFLQAAIKEI